MWIFGLWVETPKKKKREGKKKKKEKTQNPPKFFQKLNDHN